MSKPIVTFADFAKRIVIVILFLLLVLVVVGLPIYYVIGTYLHLPVDFVHIASNPGLVLAFVLRLLSTEPIKTLFALAIFPGFSFVAIYGTILMGWVERKMTAKIQLRTGPMYAGKVEGILQNVADFLKLAFKEMVIPDGVDTATFVAVPFALMAVAGALVALLPLSPTVFIANPSVGAILVFAILGFTPLVVLVAGWASNSKFPFLGGLRALHQLVAYEIPMILSLVGVVVLAGSLNLMDIVNAQAGIWYIIPEFLAAVVFYIGALAELERIPFDLPEADSELVAGWQTEYTSMLFGSFQLANFTRMYVMAGLFTTFFLGGWLGPAPVPPVVWFLVKVTIVDVFLMLPRSIMPRLRIDMLLRAGWVKLLAISFANIFLTMVLVSLGVVH
ncbi:MAG: NADH-quinone oxidoreductase subunit H [Nitrososphaerota archaeon]|jgi:NADH-quinone oxidoreductase subunit H|nr:NADH-quinone oxidoreductase subunit H [Nitrososphaerota archaeon]MDG6952974.1 NADH-quinone oxidoreductase subunit H [Nitrososphaerota archaeon]MDG6956442.1 NADH-quinone oxidoreductase subunit H [Nitrososphaerota archaeon]MDG6959594.1 NADH-quinone oxidoreductase subunit H [Nitrososphaerota archaeon]MDG6965852.1 NADH-quinone oxidoreductase subunit H [Nitrososphaerota archaeon]